MSEALAIQPKLEETVKLRRKKKQLQSDLKEVNEQLGKVNGELVEYFQDNNLENMKIEGMGLFYLASKCYPAIKDKEELVAWLKQNDAYETMVSINSRRFGAYYNELLESEQPLPPGVEQFMKTEIRLRK